MHGESCPSARCRTREAHPQVQPGKAGQGGEVMPLGMAETYAVAAPGSDAGAGAGGLDA
jgi:hypothetical protein